uniref:AFG2 interacting ribosome maturation factor n=1 Tax=Hucho hucho TaxID=62062 RepID=A0A4W5KTZ4_9TELE
ASWSALLSLCQKVWNSVLSECKPLMVSLGNIGEQLRAFQKVQIANTSLHTFPDLHQRLHFKLLQAVDIVLGKLTDKMCYLLCEMLSVSRCLMRSCYLQSLHLSLTCWEWLQDAERYYRQQFLSRKNVLQTLRADVLSLLETAPKRWAENPVKKSISGKPI